MKDLIIDLFFKYFLSYFNLAKKKSRKWYFATETVPCVSLSGNNETLRTTKESGPKPHEKKKQTEFKNPLSNQPQLNKIKNV